MLSGILIIMIHLIHLILNIIESFAFPFFIANYFNFKDKKRFIIIVFFIQLFILNIFHYFFTNSIILTVTIILSIIISIYLYTGKITFNNIFITVLYNCLIFMSALSVLIIDNTLTILFDLHKIDFFLVSCLISRLLLLAITVLILRKKLNLSVSFDFKYWSYVIILQLLLLLSVGLIIYSLTFNEINNSILITLLICLILISFLFILNLYHLNQLNKEKVSSERFKQLEKFNYQKLNTIKNIKNEIDALNHRMFYIYYNLELLLKNNKYQEAYDLLLSIRRNSAKYDIITDTKNIIFDCLISLKINDLIAQNIDINLCIFISDSEFYNSLSLINSINELIDCFHNCEKLTINITEKSNYTVIKIICLDNIIMNQTKATKIINNLSKNYNLSYELGGQIINSVKISIKREKNYEI